MQGHREFPVGIPGNLWFMKFPPGIPRNFENLQNCHFFLDSNYSILLKTRLFLITFRWTALNSEQLSHILLHGTIEWLIRTTDNEFKLVQHHCQYDLGYRNTSLQIALFPLWNNYQLPRHRHRATLGLYTEWENSVKPATHGPTLTADTNDRHCRPTLSTYILIARAEIDGRQSCGLQHLNNYSLYYEPEVTSF